MKRSAPPIFPAPQARTAAGAKPRNGVFAPFDILTSADWTLVLLLCAFLVTLCIERSRTRLLWADELYVHRMVTWPTMRGMLRGWYHGMDGGGGLYYVFVRWWSQIFGHSDISLRLFSTIGMCFALLGNWAIARRRLPTFVVAVSIGLIYLATPVVLWQEVNARFYGQFLAFAALAALYFLHSVEAEPSVPVLFVLAIAHAGLIGSHVLGLVYSFFLIAGMLLVDGLRRNLRPRIYLSAFAGWLMLPLTLHAVIASAGVAANHFWTQTPHLGELLSGVALEGRVLSYSLLTVLVIASLRLLFLPSLRRRLRITQRTLPLVVLCGALYAAQLTLYVKSQTGTSIYVDRYLLPVSIATSLLLGAALTLLLPRRMQVFSSAHVLLSSLLCIVPLSAYALARNVYKPLYPPLDYVQQVTARMPANQPVLTTLPEYTLLTTYDPGRTYLFMLDWPYDLAPARSSIDISGQHLMQNWKDGGFDADHIMNCPELFTRYPNLTILVDFTRTDWFAQRLEHNPAYSIETIDTFTRWWAPITMYSVHHTGSGPLPC